MSILVNIDNYARAEAAFQADRLMMTMGGAMNTWVHLRQPTPLDQQSVIRMNRDVMVINEEGYLNRVFHESGDHPLAVEEFGFAFVLVAARTLADPTNPRTWRWPTASRTDS